MVYKWFFFFILCHWGPKEKGIHTNPTLQQPIWKHWKHTHITYTIHIIHSLGPWWYSTDNNSINDIWETFLSCQGKIKSWEVLVILFHKNDPNFWYIKILIKKIIFISLKKYWSFPVWFKTCMRTPTHTKTHSPSACHLPTPPHRIDSTREASSKRPARGAKTRAAAAGVPTVVGLTRGGRKQASVRAKKTKQLRRTSRKELKVELANVCTWTWFFTWRSRGMREWGEAVVRFPQKSCLCLTMHTHTVGILFELKWNPKIISIYTHWPLH